jgi:putative membrane protein
VLLSQAIAAYAHYLSIFCTVALLVAEFALFRQRMEAGTVRLLPRLDLFYLIAVIAIIVTGLLRVFFFAKGVAFYRGNEMFWIKMALFVVVGLLSLPPTFAFIANRKTAAGQGLDLAPDKFRRIRSFLIAELAVFALIPLAAALMARGLSL